MDKSTTNNDAQISSSTLQTDPKPTTSLRPVDLDKKQIKGSDTEDLSNNHEHGVLHPSSEKLDLVKSSQAYALNKSLSRQEPKVKVIETTESQLSVNIEAKEVIDKSPQFEPISQQPVSKSTSVRHVNGPGLVLEAHRENYELVKTEDSNANAEQSTSSPNRDAQPQSETDNKQTVTEENVDAVEELRASSLTIPEPIEQRTVQPGKKTVLEEHGFTIGKQIGSGTYAKVKIAYSSEFKGPVAIKIISKMKAPHEYLTKFLPREIDVVRGLKHDNLIRFYQSIETTHRVYIIMQFAERGSLLDLIRQSGYLSDSLSKKYFRQLTSAIDYCHSQGVVHRDIKCENLLLDKDANLKVIDFGFARRHLKSNNRTVLSETYCGSYAYASPEVLKGTPYDPHCSDIWATGVVLFAMVYGRLPYDGSNYHQLLKQVQSKLIFPRTPNVHVLCRNLLNKILAPLKVRCSFRQMKQDAWYSQQ